MRRLLLSLLVLLVAPNAVLPQSTRLLNPTDPVYRDLDLLIQNGLLSATAIAQRPVSRAAVQSSLETASRRLRSLSIADDRLNARDARLRFLRDLIAAVRFRLDLPETDSPDMVNAPIVAPLRSISVDFTEAHEPTRGIPPTNGLGGIDATLNPLLQNRGGRPLAGGSNAYIETSHSLESQHLAVGITPELLITSALDSSARERLRLQELQLRSVFANVALDAGREYLVWGQGKDEGLLNSNNSPPLDLIKISSERPFLLPWFFQHLGPTKMSIFFARLGGDQNYPEPYAVGYRTNIDPASNLDLGVSVYTKSGGRGSPPATLTARILDLLPFLDASAYNNLVGVRGKFTFSDHYAGFDGRLRVPALSTSLYWEVLMNDFDVRRLGSVLWEDAGHVFGIHLPPIGSSGRLASTLEYHHTGVRYYEHEQFTSGQTLHQLLTGDPLGPDAQGAYAYFEWYHSVNNRFTTEVAGERRSNDQYAFLPEPQFGFRLITARPKELRKRVVLGLESLAGRTGLGALVQAGYERTRNFDFASGDDINGFLGRISVEYKFQ